MSAVVRIAIYCDGCGDKFNPLNQDDNRQQQRIAAKELGWAFIRCMDKDYCPSCTESLSKHIKIT